MKGFLVLFLMVLMGTSAYARKCYISINYSSGYSAFRMTGDFPKGIADFRYINEGTSEFALFNGTVGALLNRLSEFGYEVEFMNDYREYLLSKDQTQIEGDVNHDSEVNIADVNEVISLILGIVREHPEILEQIKK